MNFIEYARRCATAKDQKAFKSDLAKWWASLSDKEKFAVTRSRLQWKDTAYKMLDLFKNKEG